MRYLRMLTNSVVVGLLGAAYVTVLFLQLNPHLPLTAANIVPLFTMILVFYGTHLALVFYAAIVIRLIFTSDSLSPGWLSVSLLSWLGTAAATATALVMWFNLRAFAIVLDPEAATRMLWGTLIVASAAVAFLVIAIVLRVSGLKRSMAAAVLFFTVAVTSVAASLYVRGAGLPQPPAKRLVRQTPAAAEASTARVFVLLLDGASLDYISPAAAEGRLPNFGRMLDSGASMHLTTLRPTQAGPVWAAVATGKYPPKSGVRAAATYWFARGAGPLELLPDYCFSHALVYFGFATDVANTGSSLRAAPLWTILSSFGVRVGVVGWPLTYPVHPLNGFVITDRVRVGTDDFLAATIDDPGVAYPADVLSFARRPRAPDEPVLASTPGSPAEDPGLAQTAPVVRDRLYRRVAPALRDRFEPQFFALRYQGLDAAGHRLLRYAMPQSFGDVSAEERQRFGNLLERYYLFIDAEIGAAMASLRPHDLLLVVSGFGMEPVSLGKRLLARAVGDPDLTGTHERAPVGFLLAYGTHVADRTLPLGSIVDVAPTILYYLGLPVGRDMDGYARADIFTRAFTAERPITFIPSYAE